LTNYIELLKRPVAFHRIYATLGGGAASGVFISQLMYWHETMKKTHGKKWDGWFYKNGHEWEEETGTTRHEREKTEKLLKKMKIIQIKKKGIPPTKNYKVNETAFNKALDDLYMKKIAAETSDSAELPDTAKHNAEYGDTNGENQHNIAKDTAEQTGESGDINGDISPHITETTQETTTETTKPTPCPIDQDDDEDQEVFVSHKKQRLIGNKLKIFIELYEAFDYREKRAPAIDEFLEVIWPMFGNDREKNNELVEKLVCSLRLFRENNPLCSLGTSRPMLFQNWIANRRWEDEDSQHIWRMPKNSMAAVETPEWKSKGFESHEEHQRFIAKRNEFNLLNDLKAPTELQKKMIETLKQEFEAFRERKTIK
jgi:hypothetical protein